MADFDSSDSLQQSFLKWLLGFLGVIAAIKFLPKVLGFVTKRFIFGILSEIIMVILAGLLTEKAAEKLTEGDALEESLSRRR